ncbi:MAG: hypothetical protein V1664_01985 [Candidatus Uhrbacteria bacterium]
MSTYERDFSNQGEPLKTKQPLVDSSIDTGGQPFTNDVAGPPSFSETPIKNPGIEPRRNILKTTEILKEAREIGEGVEQLVRRLFQEIKKKNREEVQN